MAPRDRALPPPLPGAAGAGALGVRLVATKKPRPAAGPAPDHQGREPRAGATNTGPPLPAGDFEGDEEGAAQCDGSAAQQLGPPRHAGGAGPRAGGSRRAGAAT